jgi:hypothetical protein
LSVYTPRALRRQPRCSLRSRGGKGINILMRAIDEALNDVVLPRFGSLLRNIAGGGFAPGGDPCRLNSHHASIIYALVTVT